MKSIMSRPAKKRKHLDAYPKETGGLPVDTTVLAA